MADIRRELIDLGSQRAGYLTDAETALTNNDQAAYTAAMERVTNINNAMQQRQALLDEQERNFVPVSGAERRDMIEDRVNDMRNGRGVAFTADEVRREIRNSLTIGGKLTEPVGSSTTIHDPVGVGYSSIIDQVRTIDLTGLSAWQEPYVKSVLEGKGAVPKTAAGTLRTESNATFGIAELRPYEVTVTSYVDRNIERLTNAAYYDKVYSMAMTALRKKIAEMIVKGDGESNNIFYGIKTAKNKAGDKIYAEKSGISAIGVETLDDLYFAYGDDESVGGNARLLLSKANLAIIGKLRSTTEKTRLFKIAHAAGSSNTGTIEDGGTIIPYTLSSAVGGTDLLYGDLANYLLGLFGNYSIRVDESYKAGERLLTILGDAMVGGNLVVDKGFVVAAIGG